MVTPRLLKVLCLSLALWASATQAGSNTPLTPVVPTVDNGGSMMVVRVHVYDKLEDVRAAHRTFMQNRTPTISSQILAWSVQYTLEDGTWVCEILVVRPIMYGDVNWMYWGHELGHCVYGNWHLQEQEP